MVFKLPIYEHMTYEYLQYNHSPIRQDRLALCVPLLPLTPRINACVLDYTQSPQLPDNMTLWDEFDPVYYDGEVALMNPVDEKVAMVAMGARWHLDEGRGSTVLQS